MPMSRSKPATTGQKQQKQRQKEQPAPVPRIIWVLLALVVLFLLFFAGLTIGYVVLGNGPLAEVFQLETWVHMFELVFAP